MEDKDQNLCSCRNDFVCLACWAFSNQSAVAQSAGEPQPLAIVALAGYDALIEDINFVGSLGGQQDLAQSVEQMIMLFTQNKGLAGLDKSKPLGLVVQSNGMDISGAVCIPVTSLKELTTTLMPFGVMAKEGANGLTEISANGQTLLAKEKNGWAFLSVMPQMLENLPEDPGKVLGTSDERV